MLSFSQNKKIFPEKNVGEIDLPFIEAPAYKHTTFKKKDEQFQIYSDELNRNGFCIFDLNINEHLIKQANHDIEDAIKKNHIKLNSIPLQ